MASLSSFLPLLPIILCTQLTPLFSVAMGKGKSQRKNEGADDTWDSFDTDSVFSGFSLASDQLLLDSESAAAAAAALDSGADSSNLLDQAVDALFEKRETALTSILHACTRKLQYEFVENNFETLLHQCLRSIKKGSAKETTLASHIIGMLALTIGPGEKAQEILKTSVSPIQEALKSKPDMTISALLECMAIIAFIGGDEPEETEKLMQTMWQVVDPELGSNVVAVKPSPHTVKSAVSAWSFLLTTMNSWTLDLKDWQEFISYLSCLLDQDDRSVRIVAGEALALIFEMGNLEKFSDAATCSSESFSHDGTNAKKCTYRPALMEKILDQVRSLSMEAGGRGCAKKDLNHQRNTFRVILQFLEDGYGPKTSIKIGVKSLKTTTWSQLIQLNNLKQFFGGGFVKQMQDNEILHEIFGFSSKGPGTENRLPHLRKRMLKSVNKARSRLLKQERMSHQYMNYGDCPVAEADGSW